MSAAATAATISAAVDFLACGKVGDAYDLLRRNLDDVPQIAPDKSPDQSVDLDYAKAVFHIHGAIIGALAHIDAGKIQNGADVLRNILRAAPAHTLPATPLLAAALAADRAPPPTQPGPK
jgi:hypothetical protein